MSDVDVKSLLLQVDASVELLRKNLASGEGVMDRFERRGERMAQVVDDAIGKMGQRFGPFAQLAESAAQKAQKSFESSFTQIQQLAAKAISAPRLEGGGLNLGSADAKAAAVAAHQQAIALGLIAEAAERAAAGEGVLTRETQLYLQAARAARVEAEQNARTLAQEAGAIERLEIELNQAAGAHRQLQVAQRGATASSGQMRAASQQLSYQISDVAVSFAGGINPMVIFAQQGSQVVQAISMMRAESSGLIGFLGGPWGAALLGAVSLIGILASKHYEAADASKEHKKAADALKDAVDRLNNASATLNRTTRQGIIDDINKAEAMRLREIQTRKNIQAELELAQARLKANLAQANRTDGGGDGGRAAAGASAALATINQSQIDDLNKQIAEQGKKIVEANRAIGAGTAKLVMRDVAASTDAATAATQRYEDAVDSLQRKWERGGFGDPRSASAQAELNRQLTQVTRTRDASLESLKKKSGPSAETLRRREIRDDISYSEEERRARHRLLDAMQKTAATEDERLGLLREDINAEADALQKKVAGQLALGKITAAEAAHLNQVNEATRRQKLQNVEIDRTSSLLAEKTEAEQHSLGADIALLRIQQDLATTNAERKRIALQILEREQALARISLQQVIDDPKSSEAAVRQARADRERLADIQTAQRGQAEQTHEGPGARFARELHESKDQIIEDIEGIKVDGLNALNDELVNAIMGAESLGAAFKNVANQIIADLLRIAIRQAIIKPLASALGFGFADGGEIPGFASGGMFAGPGGPRSDSLLARVSPGEFIINAESTRRYLPLIAAINDNRLPGFADGGPVPGRLSLPSISNASLQRGGNGGVTVIVNAQDAVLADTVRQWVADGVAQASVRGAVGGKALALQESGRQRRQALY